MEIRETLHLLRHWWWMIVLGVVVGSAGAYGFSNLQKPVFRATATLLVSQGDVAQSNDLGGLQTSERLAQSYVERLKNYEVLDAALDNVGLRMDPSDLVENMQVRLVDNTQLIRLSVEHTDQRLAQALANEIPEVFAERNREQQLERFAESKASLQEELQRLQEEMEAALAALAGAQESEQPASEVERLQDNLLRLRDTHSQLLQSYEDVRVAEAQSLNNVIVDEPARRPLVPVRPRTVQNSIAAAVAGGMVSVAVVFLLDYVDNTVKNPQEMERLVGLSTLGSIARMEIVSLADSLVVAHKPRAPVAEAYRQLRTNLLFSLAAGQQKSILVTSANARAGKTTAAANLASALAQTGRPVVLVDSDLRRPALHKIFQVNGSEGLSSLFMDTTLKASLLQETGVPGLRVLAAGAQPPNPAELLGTERMRQVAAWLARQADFVVYDSPPLLTVTDAAVLSRLVGATLLVVRAGQTTLPALQAAAKQLRNVDATLAGAVLNGVSRCNDYYAYYSYEAQYSCREPAGPSGNGYGVLGRLRRGKK